MFTVRLLMFAIHIEEDERNLAERLKRREPAAMAELYDRYGALVQTQADGEFGWAPLGFTKSSPCGVALQ